MAERYFGHRTQRGVSGSMIIMQNDMAANNDCSAIGKRQEN